MNIQQSYFLDRFLDYVKIDTQSDPNSKTYPSTSKQLNLSKKLFLELKDLGLDAELTSDGYVIATLKSNVDYKVPVIGLIAHVDTSPDVSGKNVKPVVHKKYKGAEIWYSNFQKIRFT